MKRRKLCWIFLLVVSPILLSHCTGKDDEPHEFKTSTIEIPSLDSLLITADLYIACEKTAPFILLCHRAKWSRGEYLDIAPRLNEMGFNCMAIDQRSGKEINGVPNETRLRAKEQDKGRFYINALPDIEAAVQYVRDRWEIETIIIWGSSYSAAIAFIIGSRFANDIDGIVAFSPGEYVTLDNNKVAYFAGKISCPVFITSARDERKKWEGIYDAIPSGKKSFYLPDKGGKHGSEALWKANDNSEEYWAALEAFLKEHFPAR